VATVRPVLLSVGYAACHWCHVMAHESFSDEAIAAYLNEHFVAVEVDREERPDVDAVYTEATQASTGPGGWPMTCFLTPDGDPFHCGTYYPDTLRGGMPSFPQLLEAVVRAWRTDGDRVRGAAKEIRERLASVSRSLPAADVDPAARRRRRLARRGVRRRARRVRRGAQVPAVGGAGVPAAPPRAHRLDRGRDGHHAPAGTRPADHRQDPTLEQLVPLMLARG